MLSDQSIVKFQELYRRHFGQEISREEACEKGAKLLRLVELVYRPMTKAEFQTIQKHRRVARDA